MEARHRLSSGTSHSEPWPWTSNLPKYEKHFFFYTLSRLWYFIVVTSQGKKKHLCKSSVGIIDFINSIKKPRMFQNSSAHSHTLVTKLKLGWQTQCWAQFGCNQHHLILGKLTGLMRKHRERCGREREGGKLGLGGPCLLWCHFTNYNHNLAPKHGYYAWNRSTD